VPTGTDGTPVAEELGVVVVVVLPLLGAVGLDVVVDCGAVVVVDAGVVVDVEVEVLDVGLVSADAVGTATTLASATDPTTAHIVTKARRKRTDTSNLNVSGFPTGAAESLPRDRRPSDAKLSKVESALGLVLPHPPAGTGIGSRFDRVGAGPAADRRIAAFDQRVDRDVVIRDIATHI
jgi:hypothetical protein